MIYKVLLIFLVSTSCAKVFFNTTDANEQSDAELYRENIQVPSTISEVLTRVYDDDDNTSNEAKVYKSGLILYLYPQSELLAYQIGVLRALEEKNLKVDKIYASGWGAFVAYLWLNGFSAKEINNICSKNENISNLIFSDTAAKHQDWISSIDVSSIEWGRQALTWKEFPRQRFSKLDTEVSQLLGKYSFPDLLNLVHSGPEGVFLGRNNLKALLLGFQSFPSAKKIDEDWFWPSIIYGDKAHGEILEAEFPKVLMSLNFFQNINDSLLISLRGKDSPAIDPSQLLLPYKRVDNSVSQGYRDVTLKMDFLLKKISKGMQRDLRQSYIEWGYTLEGTASEYHSNLRNKLNHKSPTEVHQEVFDLILKNKYSFSKIEYTQIGQKQRLDLQAQSLNPAYYRLGAYADKSSEVVVWNGLEVTMVDELEYKANLEAWGGKMNWGTSVAFVIKGWEAQPYYLDLRVTIKLDEFNSISLNQDYFGEIRNISLGYEYQNQSKFQTSFVQENAKLNMSKYTTQNQPPKSSENVEISGLRVQAKYFKNMNKAQWIKTGRAFSYDYEARNFTRKGNQLEKGDLVFWWHFNHLEAFSINKNLGIQFGAKAGLALLYEAISEGKQIMPYSTFRTDFQGSNTGGITNEMLERLYQIPIGARLASIGYNGYDDYSNQFIYGSIALYYQKKHIEFWIKPQYLYSHNSFLNVFEKKRFLETNIRSEWKSLEAYVGFEYDLDDQENTFFFQLGKRFF